MDHKNNAPALKAFASLLILALAFTLLIIFNNYKEQIIVNNQFQLYMILATVGAGLLLSLLYFVNKPHPTHSSKKIRKAKKKK